MISYMHTCLISTMSFCNDLGLLNRKNINQKVAGMVLPTEAHSIASWKGAVMEPLSNSSKYSKRFLMKSELSSPRYFCTASNRISRALNGTLAYFTCDGIKQVKVSKSALDTADEDNSESTSLTYLVATSGQR